MLLYICIYANVCESMYLYAHVYVCVCVFCVWVWACNAQAQAHTQHTFYITEDEGKDFTNF